jgi:histidinol-phosphate/aromatic aminotransferase/cobyric acid decarboxylase-like protein
MTFPVDLSLVRSVNHMPAVPVLERSMNRPDLQLHDFCIPVNSYFPSHEVFDDLRNRLREILRYYPSDNQTVSELLAELLDLNADNIVAANGSTELITWINEKLIRTNLVTDVPTFGRWTDNARELGRVVYPFFRRRDEEFRIDVQKLVQFVQRRNGRAMVICNPSNPTAAVMTREQVRQLLDATRHLDVVVVDESFIDFVAEDHIPSVASDIVDYDNVIVLKSLGKNFGLHGLRCGYAVASKQIVSMLRHVLPPWNVNALAEEFIRVMSTHGQQYEWSRRQTVRDSRRLEYRLAQIDGLTSFPSHANFVYCELDDVIPGEKLRDVLLHKYGCFIRECGSKLGSTSQFLRIATRPKEQQDVLIGALAKTCASICRTAGAR